MRRLNESGEGNFSGRAMERFRGRSFFRGLSWSYCKTRKVKKVELDVGVEYPVRLARQHDRVGPQPHHEADDQHLKKKCNNYSNCVICSVMPRCLVDPCPCDGKWTKEAAYICPILNICTDFKTYTFHKISHRKI